MREKGLQVSMELAWVAEVVGAVLPVGDRCGRRVCRCLWSLRGLRRLWGLFCLWVTGAGEGFAGVYGACVGCGGCGGCSACG